MAISGKSCPAAVDTNVGSLLHWKLSNPKKFPRACLLEHLSMLGRDKLFGETTASCIG